MRTKAAARCWASAALVGVAPLVALGCSGGDGLPLGGPFGGTVPSDVQDAGGLGDGNGVLPFTSSSFGKSVSGGSGAPTWTQLFGAYLAVGTIGNCGHSGCHQGSMDNPAEAYSFLQREGQVGGPQPAINDPSSSCFTWLGGDMPPGGPDTDPIAVGDFGLWAKAGAKNN